MTENTFISLQRYERRRKKNVPTFMHAYNSSTIKHFNCAQQYLFDLFHLIFFIFSIE